MSRLINIGTFIGFLILFPLVIFASEQQLPVDIDKNIKVDFGNLDFIKTVSLLKSLGFTVNVEGPFALPQINLGFDEATVTVKTVLDKFKKASGFEYSINGSQITLYDAAFKPSDTSFPLNQVIMHFDATSVPNDEVLENLSKQSGVSIEAVTFTGHGPNVTLHMANVTIAEILNEISKQSASKGWYSYIKNNNGKFRILIVFE